MGKNAGCRGLGQGYCFMSGDQGSSSDDHLGTELNGGERHMAGRQEGEPSRQMGGVWGTGKALAHRESLKSAFKAFLSLVPDYFMILPLGLLAYPLWVCLTLFSGWSTRESYTYQ